MKLGKFVAVTAAVVAASSSLPGIAGPTLLGQRYGMDGGMCSNPAHVDVVAGLRYDNFDIGGTDLFPAVDWPFARKDEKVSPRLGLIFKPQENISLYGSYSQSFLPRSGDQFLTLSPTQQNLAPEQFINHEVGAKWDIRPDLNVTAAVFRLDRTNATTPDPLNPTVTINVGETRTESQSLNQQAQQAQQQIDNTSGEFSQLQQELQQAKNGIQSINQTVLELEQRYQQTHQHLSAIEQVTSDAYSQMASIDQAAKDLLSGTARTQQQLGRFARN